MVGADTASCSVDGEYGGSMERQPEARLSQLLGHLSADACSGGREDESATRPELIPFGFEGELLRSRWAREHLRWMRRKDILGQDMFLLATYGPLRRWLALAFCQRLGREMDYVALTQDQFVLALRDLIQPMSPDQASRSELAAGQTACSQLDLARAFRVLDADANGKVGLDEMKPDPKSA